MLRRRLRYAPGGTLPTFNADYAQAGIAASNLYDSISPEDRFGVKSDFSAGLGTGLKRAGEYATLGSAFGPVGTGIGAGVGLVSGAIEGIGNNNKKKVEEQRANILEDRREYERSKGVLNNYSQGNNTNQIYAKYGGSIHKMLNGGNLKSLSTDNVEVEGPSHEEGGVALAPGVEVEGGETINKNYVFSEELGYAKLHKPIARAIGKLEKKPESNLTRTSLERLRTREEALKVEQENTKAALGVATPQKYALGGETPPGRGQRIAEAYNNYLKVNDGFKPLAPVEETDPVFYNEKNYNDYYTSKAASRLSPEEQQVYRNHKNQGRPEDAQNLLILRGGTVGYDTYKNFIPKEDPNPMTATATLGSRLTARRDVSRVGFNKGQGRLGFRVR